MRSVRAAGSHRKTQRAWQCETPSKDDLTGASDCDSSYQIAGALQTARASRGQFCPIDWESSARLCPDSSPCIVLQLQILADYLFRVVFFILHSYQQEFSTNTQVFMTFEFNLCAKRLIESYDK